MERDRLNRLEREVALIARQIAGLPIRIGEAGGGGGATVATKFAIVIAEAEADRATIGTCLLLDEDLEPSVEMDPMEEGYDLEALENAYIEFKSADFVDAEVGKRITISALKSVFGTTVADEIVPGSTFDEVKVYGCLVEYPLPGITCETIEYVTSVACVADAITYETEVKEVVTGPCP